MVITHGTRNLASQSLLRILENQTEVWCLKLTNLGKLVIDVRDKVSAVVADMERLVNIRVEPQAVDRPMRTVGRVSNYTYTKQEAWSAEILDSMQDQS